MEEYPLISVIIPVYNVERWLERCANSVLVQSYHELEIILIDDGSTDHSGALCDQLAEKDNRIIVIHKENGGLSDARNTGLKKATGTFISFIDSDDWIERDFLTNLYKTMVQTGADVSGCTYRKCFEGKIYLRSSKDYSVVTYTKTEAMRNLIENHIQQVVWNKLYKRTKIKDVCFEAGKYHEDEFWSYQIFGRIDKYAETDYVGYNYLQRADSIMGERYTLKRLDAVEAKERRQRYLNKSMRELSSLGRINLLFTCFFHGQQAIGQMDKDTQKAVFTYLNEVLKRNSITKEDMKNLKVIHRIWAAFSIISLKRTCQLRNVLKVGN